MKQFSLLIPLIIVIILNGCQHCVQYNTIENDITFDNIKEDFYSDIGIDVSHINIGFVDELKGEAVANCVYYPINASKNFIKVKRSWWKGATDILRKALIYHELGHCAILYYDHINNLRPDRCPVSLMHSYVINSYCLQRHWYEYITQLEGLK